MLFERIAPLASAVGALCAGEPTAGLSIVREFRLSSTGADLGFWLDEEWVGLLHRTGATIDVDEYDYLQD